MRWSSLEVTERSRSPTSSANAESQSSASRRRSTTTSPSTTISFGFDSAVSFATDAIDRLHTTAEAHHRVIVVEVMGRYAGWIALHAGVAGGADVILIPEIPYDLDKVAHHILAREGLGARFSIVVAAEGATAVGAGYTIRQLGSASAAERLGGIGERLVKDLECKTHKEMRSVTLGHLQRGGAPTSADRLLATRFGARALELVLEQKWGTMVALQPPDIMAEGQFQPPKTQKAVRTIPLGPHAIAALTAHRQRVSRRAPEALVFGNRKGDPLRESKLLTNVLQPAAEAAGLGRVTWHQFRHIHSSLLNDLKVPVKIAQEQLGHASISTTLNIYTHVVDASHRTAVEAVEARLFSDVDPNGPKLAIVPKTDSAVNARSA